MVYKKCYGGDHEACHVLRLTAHELHDLKVIVKKAFDDESMGSTWDRYGIKNAIKAIPDPAARVNLND